MQAIIPENRAGTYEKLIYLCVLMACFVPRYIATFKIHLAINVSLYTIAVAVVWLMYVRRFKLFNSIECYFFLIWFLFVIGSLWRAEKMGVWAYYLDWTLTAVLFAQLLYHSNKRKVFSLGANALFLGLLIHSLIGLYEVLTHHYLFEVGDFNPRYYGTTPVSIFYNPNDYATFIVTLFPFSVYQFFHLKKTAGKILAGMVVIASLFLIIKSESRGALVSVLLIACAVAFLYIRKADDKKRLILAMIAFATCILFFMSPGRYYLGGMISSISVDPNGIDLARINLIKNGLYFLKQTHGFGVGAGNLYLWLTERSIYYIGKLGFIHNWYVELLVTFGVLFFVLYMIFHIKVLMKLAKSFNKGASLWTLNNTFFVSFLCFSFASISSSSNIYSEWVWMYLVFVSAYVLVNYKSINREKLISNEP